MVKFYFFTFSFQIIEIVGYYTVCTVINQALSSLKPFAIIDKRAGTWEGRTYGGARGLSKPNPG
jgi:hypothetical protein